MIERKVIAISNIPLFLRKKWDMFNYEYLSKSSFFQDLTIEGNAKGACRGGLGPNLRLFSFICRIGANILFIFL